MILRLTPAAEADVKVFSRGMATEVTTLVTSSFKRLISASTPSNVIRWPSQSSTMTFDVLYSIDSPIVSSTSCPSRRSSCWPAFTGIGIPKSGRVGETHNRLKLAARGRSESGAWLRSRAAA